MAQSRRHSKFHVNRMTIVGLAVGLVVLYAVLPELGNFHDSLNSWSKLDVSWLLIAIAAAPVSYLLATAMYMLLKRRPLKFWPTGIVQVAGLFANRVLPAGIGTVSVNYLYLRKQRHTQLEAAAVVATNNTLGLLGHISLFVILLLTTHVHWLPPRLPSRPTLLVVGVVVTIVVALLLWMRRLRIKVERAVFGTLRTMLAYRRRPDRLLAALGVSILLTSCYALGLYACAQALGLHIGIVPVFVALTAGLAGGIVLPTPGGLGGTEAGLVGALVAYNLTSGEALGLALLYRLLTFWLALILGAAALVFIEKREYI